MSFVFFTFLDIPKIMSEAADLVAEADMYDTYIRQKGRWDLLTKQAVTIAAVGFKTRGRVGRCEFPDTLGKMSTMKKRHRLLHEFVVQYFQKLYFFHVLRKICHCVSLCILDCNLL